MKEKRKFIDKQGRLFGVISIIDIVVIAVVIVLAVSVYTKFFVLENSATTSKSQDISYSVTVSAVRECIADSIKPGDTLYDQDKGTAIGTVTGVNVVDAKKALAMPDGSTINAPVENRCDIVLDIDADGLISEGRYYVGRTYEINSGSTRNLCTKYVSFSAVISEIK